ncbi:beta-lactamase-like protein [Roridomyces roridus]|uniref:Beta-lactamase-like protein n=1 Tax=Roridomyces roridus TaxID=1738132 RepID=A0AAD7B9U3_9AGAR|nr:beta-lactamase-like protein [Roridomyces roridus]
MSAMTPHRTTMSKTAPLPIPADNQPYMLVSALEAGTLYIPSDVVLAGEPRTVRAIPSLAFYFKHSASDRHFILDLGVRRAFESYPPTLKGFYGRLGKPVEVPQDVVESCLKGGVDPATVEHVIITHLHWDHIGDHSPFTKATFTLGGGAKALLDDGYPGNPTSVTLSDSTPSTRTVFLAQEDFTTSIGPFPHALDYFGDGSVYIIHTPGHLPGHLSILARTSSDGAWMYFGGDVAHDPRLLTDPSTDIATSTAGGLPFCIHGNPVCARLDIARVRELVKLPRVEFVLAHDWQWARDNSDAYLPGRIVPKV